MKLNVGVAECFIQAEGNKMMVFVHIPILVMMVINLVLYLVTVYSLTKHSKQTAAVKKVNIPWTGVKQKNGIGKEAKDQMVSQLNLCYTYIYHFLGLQA